MDMNPISEQKDRNQRNDRQLDSAQPEELVTCQKRFQDHRAHGSNRRQKKQFR